ncbi:formate dehydrogenase accessory sulfurtransferase FdhD [Flavicella marina]|uniref:formate dehydrogenase accessory sulfurtransferase FdhD n=1 Tax=Flavicella marina TaxID=1475951 RepID=UPI001264D75C|nr:formate dehydrogenase accessory sulfurtransferase FdhD [Flavicella marina]
MQTSIYKSLKKQNENSIEIDDYLVIEAPIEISINNEPFTMVMRTPGNDVHFLRGLLFAEDIYKGNQPLTIISIETKTNGFTKVNINISETELGGAYLNKRSLLSVSSCGICGKQELNDINPSKKRLKSTALLDIDKLPEMFEVMREKQHTFDLTGGSHAAVIFDKFYNFLCLFEDIGRHNAVDKCIGKLLNTNKISDASFLLVSGRVSYEIISKAFFAKITTIVAVSACSSLAVDYAKELGICLIGFSRNGKATVYANPQHIL